MLYPQRRLYLKRLSPCDQALATGAAEHCKTGEADLSPYLCIMVMATPGGSFVYHFHEATTLSDILTISHGLVLTHLPNGELHPGRDQPLFWRIAEIYRNVEARRGGTALWTMAEDTVASRPFLYPAEQVGMFLQIRIASRFCLSYCSRWYQETVRGEVATIIALRQRENRIQHHREQLGCICRICRIEWLEQGWTCPLVWT